MSWINIKMTIDKIYKIKFKTEAKNAENILEKLEEIETSVLFDEKNGIYNFELIFQEAPDINNIANLLDINKTNLILENEPNKDWLKENLASFKPIICSDFYIFSEYAENAHCPKGLIPLKLNAATAFGSGEHSTTQGCLSALSILKNQENIKKILDMGCGSGILSFAAAKLFKTKVIAADIDPESVRVTIENSNINNCAEYVEAFASDGYKNEKITNNAPFDLIIANILANPLCEMAADLAKNLNKSGMAILSGLLNEQERQVINAHINQGLETVQIIQINGWSAIIMRKK